MGFICLFFPTFIAMGNDVNTKNIYKVIYEYIVYNLIINFLSFYIIRVITDSELVIDNNLWTIRFSPKFLLLSSTIAYILPRIIKYLKNNISISIKRLK